MTLFAVFVLAGIVSQAATSVPEVRRVELVGVQEVLVPVVVREALPSGGSGQPVAGLVAADFTVLEDGVGQTILSFSTEPLPASIVIAVDTSPSMEADLWSVRRAVGDFARNRPAGAALAVLSFNDRTAQVSPFTEDGEAVARAAASLRTGGTRTDLWNAVMEGTRLLTTRAGPRALVVFTDGADSDQADEPGEARRAMAMKALLERDVTLFGILWGRGDRAPIETLARPTGGEVVAARAVRELMRAFGRIGESLESRYILGYAPPHPERGGDRRIEVRVARDGIRVFAREGYTLAPSAP